MNRKKNGTYILLLDTATTSLCGTGTTMASGYIAAAVSRITGNATEPASGVIHSVLHPYQIKDVQDEITAGVGTYALPAGMSADIFRKGFSGTLFNTNVWSDGNITIDSTPDVKGGVHAKEAVVCVQGRSPRTAVVRLEHIGGGAEDLFMYDEYVFVQRSAGNWLYEIYSDATAPTS